jgi:hypothetical protein
MLPLVSVHELLQKSIGPVRVIEKVSLPVPGSPLSQAFAV